MTNPTKFLTTIQAVFPDIIQPIDLQFMPKVMMIPIKMGGLSTHEEW